MSDLNPNPLLAVPTQVTVNDVTQTEIDPRKKAQLESLGHDDAGWWASLWAHLWASVFDGLAVLAAHFSNALDVVLAFVARFFVLGQGEKNPAFYDLSAKILEDLTGVTVDAAALKASEFGSGRLAAMQTFGGDLYKLLEQEFRPTSGNLDTPDDAPAQRFLGFLMNFAIRQGNIEVLTSMLPESVRVGEGFRAYGELMAKNLALGRMARRALQPLIQTLVADPLQNKLNQQYLPKRLAKEQAIKAYFRGTIDLTKLRDELSQEGYSPERQDFMISDSRPTIGDRELIHLMFRGQLADPDFSKEFGARGYDANAQFLVTESERPTLDRAEILDLYEFGQLSREDALSWLGKLGYDTDTAELVVLGFEMKIQAVPRPKPIRHKARTFSQLRKEFLDGVIDLLELQSGLSQAGYGDDDISALVNDVLVDQSRKKSTGAKQAIPRLSWAQLKDAYKMGILTLAAVTEHLQAHGYTPADVQALLKELPAPPPPPATPTV
jgi:hypothetical protein